MSIFETIKAAVRVPQAAAYYGMKIQRNNMARCCFLLPTVEKPTAGWKDPGPGISNEMR